MGSETGPGEWRSTLGEDTAARLYGRPAIRRYDHYVDRRGFEERQLALGTRQAEVVLALRRPGGGYLLHTKWFYPQGVYRLLSGGIKPDEPLLEALERELREETSLGGRVERYLAVQRHVFHLTAAEVPFTTHILLVAGAVGEPAPLDAQEGITQFREVPLRGLSEVADQLEDLPPDWLDWGRYRATAHRLVVELLGVEERVR
ncbi:MAG: NUDIX domain-containing protein [Chloroflexi bacterium]|nr:NUDIX domain-containing protein [Chloroflexota bacterium]